VGVRRGVEQALEVARAELQAQARPIDLPDEIARIVLGTVRDEKIAEMIGEVVDGVGPDGAVLVENAHGIETTYQYLEGVHWDEGWHSPSFLRENEAIVRLLDPRILCSDMPIEKPDELVPILDACAGAGVRSLFVVAPEIKDAALSLLIVNRERGILESVAVKAPSHGNQRTRIPLLPSRSRRVDRHRDHRRLGRGATGLGQAARVRHPRRTRQPGRYPCPDRRGPCRARHGQKR
jgi:chaperonin GroEL